MYNYTRVKRKSATQCVLHDPSLITFRYVGITALLTVQLIVDDEFMFTLSQLGVATKVAVYYRQGDESVVCDFSTRWIHLLCRIDKTVDSTHMHPRKQNQFETIV